MLRVAGVAARRAARTRRATGRAGLMLPLARPNDPHQTWPPRAARRRGLNTVAAANPVVEPRAQLLGELLLLLQGLGGGQPCDQPLRLALALLDLREILPREAGATRRREPPPAAPA